MKNLLEEHRTKREKAIAEHKQNELLRIKAIPAASSGVF